MADPQKAGTKPAQAEPASKGHSTKRRVKASSPAHRDLIRVRRLVSTAVADLKRVSSLETPTDKQVEGSLRAFEALIKGPIAASEVARSMLDGKE